MKLLDRLERTLSPFAIPHLTLVLVIGQAVGMYLLMIDHPVIEKWYLVGDKVKEGEYHRLVLFLFAPAAVDILYAFCLYFFWLMGTVLENQWGRFRYNLYILIAVLASIALALLAPHQTTDSWVIGVTVFLAFAWMLPDFVVMLFFVIPVKVKYLALVTWIGLIFGFAFGTWMDRGMIVISLGNFLLFFGGELFLRARWGHRLMQQAAGRYKPFHRCAICGMTEKKDRKMEFRVCSRCDGELEYCEIHLNSHTHRRKSNHPEPVEDEETT